MVSLIIIALLIFGFFMGLRRGFVLQLMHLIGFLISFIVAIFLYKKLAEHLALWIPYPEISNDTILAVFLDTMPLESAFYNAIAFAMIFFLTKIVLQIITSMLDFIARLPFIRTVNGLFGAALGFIEVYVIIFILLFIAALVPIDMIQLRLEGSTVAKLIIEHTPILTKYVESLWFVEIINK